MTTTEEQYKIQEEQFFLDWKDANWKDTPVDVDYNLTNQKGYVNSRVQTRWQWDERGIGYWQIKYNGPGNKVEHVFLPCKGPKLWWFQFKFWFERVRMQWLT